jgi:hypothetical protein
MISGPTGSRAPGGRSRSRRRQTTRRQERALDEETERLLPKLLVDVTIRGYIKETLPPKEAEPAAEAEGDKPAEEA